MNLPIETEAGLILPGHPFFNHYLQSELPPNWREFANKHPDFAFVVRPDGSGLFEPVTEDELEEYCEDGELDAREAELEAQDLIFCP
jgi:hypothetical protein